MGRIISIDYGAKRSGFAATDPLKIIVSPIDSISTVDLMDYITNYIHSEEVDQLVIGYPTHKDGTQTYLCEEIDTFLSQLITIFPSLEIVKVEESYSSVEAQTLLAQAVKNKKKRQEKGQLDMYSAVVILRRYLKY